MGWILEPAEEMLKELLVAHEGGCNVWDWAGAFPSVSLGISLVWFYHHPIQAQRILGC